MNRLCPVCQHEKSELLYRPAAAPGPVSRCLRCEMVYVSAIENDKALIFDGPVEYGEMDAAIMMSADLDDVKDSWELQMLPHKLAEWPALRQNAAEALQLIERECSTDGRRILDFGSGFGFFLAVAKEMGWEAFGMEPLPASAVYARATYGVDIKTDTLREDSYPADFFDVIASFQVFEHLPDPAGDVAKLRHFLKPGGLILIEVPNIDTWTVSLMGERHRHFVQDHLNLFSAETLGKMLTDSGFEVIEHFNPVRRMSIRHLSQQWMGRFLPAAINRPIQTGLQRTPLWERTISMNVGDILTVVGRKV